MLSHFKQINKITMNNKNYNFSKNWLAGFTQSDGCFSITFKNSKYGMPIRPRAVFNLTQNKIELNMFLELQKYLGIGNLYFNRNNVILEVTSIKDILEFIIPLFDENHLRGEKLLSYLKFKEVCISIMMDQKKHLNLEDLLIIIELSYFMNGKTSLRTEFTKNELLNKLKLKYNLLPNKEDIEIKTNLIEKKITTNYNSILNKNNPINLEFIRGEIDGDGSFNISFRTSRRRIGVNFTVIHELSNISVLEELKQFFGCGSVYNLSSAAARFQVQTLDEMIKNVLPKLKNIEFNTIKQNHFEIFVKVCDILTNEGYKSDENLLKIVNLCWDMNQLGKNRKLSKFEYLSLFIKDKNLIKFINNP